MKPTLVQLDPVNFRALSPVVPASSRRRMNSATEIDARKVVVWYLKAKDELICRLRFAR